MSAHAHNVCMYACIIIYNVLYYVCTYYIYMCVCVYIYIYIYLYLCIIKYSHVLVKVLPLT